MSYGFTHATDTTKTYGALSNYSVSRSAQPADPSDSSRAFPTASATLAKTDGAPEIIEEEVRLTDVFGKNFEGTVKQYSKNTANGKYDIDIYSIFEKLNSEQTVFPVKGGVLSAIEYAFLESGITKYKIPGNVQHYRNNGGYGWIANSPVRMMTNTDFSTNRLTPTTHKELSPLMLDSSTSILLGVELEAGGVNSKAQFHFEADGIYHNFDIDAVYFEDGTTGETWTQIEVAEDTMFASSPTIIASIKAPAVNQLDMIFVNVKASRSGSTVSFTVNVIKNDVVVGTGSGSFASVLLQRPRFAFFDSPNAYYISYIKAATPLPVTMPLQLGFWAAPTELASAAVPGYRGNVWEMLKKLLVAYRLEMTLGDNGIYIYSRGDINPIQSSNTAPFRPSAITTTESARETVKELEISINKWQNSFGGFGATGPMELWRADSVYTIEKGEVQEHIIETEAIIVEARELTPVSGVPVPYTWNYGSYVITGADGYIVDPQWWLDNGGSITVALTESPNQLKITITAPSVVTPRAPYRVSEGVADRPALYVFGLGTKLLSTRKVRVLTGATNGSTTPLEYDNPFITTDLAAYDIAADMGGSYSNPKVTKTFTEPYSINPDTDEVVRPAVLQEGNGTGEGAVFYHEGSNFKVTSLTINPKGYTVNTAEKFNSIKFLNLDFANKTIDDWNTYHAGKTVKDINLAPRIKYIS